MTQHVTLNTIEKRSKPVRILPPHLVNRIAAGEVVERPASVIKELVENALDAGASRIEVQVSAAGRTLRISDNGSGMNPEDAALAFYNHATSKIQTEEDLHQIHTLGFRGEALASIAAISKLTCLTRTEDTPNGIRISFDPLGDDPTQPIITPTGCAVGTVMEVADLFYNTPARLKFLKRPATEVGHIEEIVETLALSHPEVRFRLVNNDRQTINTQGSGDLKQVIHDVFRLDRDPIELIEIQFEDKDAGYRVQGFTSVPGVMKSSKRWLVTFANGRTIRCSLLQKAIETAYSALLPQGRYPLCVLHLTLPVDEIDVNVHPTKREVRYANSHSIFSFVQIAIKRALENSGLSHFSNPALLNIENSTGENFNSLPSSPNLSNTINPLWSSTSISQYQHTNQNNQWQSNYSARSNERAYIPTDEALLLQSPLEYPSNHSQQQNNLLNQNEASLSQKPQYKVLGQLFNTYILLETVQGLMVVDQHIASERELFERISLQMLHEIPATQTTLATQAKNLSPTQFDLLHQHQETFQKLGFTYRLDQEQSSLQLTGVPLIYQDRSPNQDPGRLFDDLLQQLENTGEAHLGLDERVNNLIATLACHSAVRAGDNLSPSDMEQVIDGWLTSKLPWTCPHGRPIAHTIPKEELNKFFHRPSLPVNSM